MTWQQRVRTTNWRGYSSVVRRLIEAFVLMVALVLVEDAISISVWRVLISGLVSLLIAFNFVTRR